METPNNIWSYSFIESIEDMARPPRAKTFRAAAEFILQHDCKMLVETGCFRGIPHDGQSTLILATLARAVGGTFTSYEIREDHVEKAKALLSKHGFDNCDHAAFVRGDSVTELSRIPLPNVRFAYLDSFDHDQNNPGPCQRHELAEIGAIYGKMKPPCAILLDDYIPETGGKTKLGSQFLEDRGWKLAAKGYQLLYTLGC